jgi:histidinol-phosphate aminotransferase
MSATLDRLIATRIRQDVQSMHAYAVQDSRGLVKLDAMENPHRLPTELRRQLGERLAEVALNRYPGEGVAKLKEALARHAKLPSGFDLMLGNGSDELISLLAMACDLPGAAILAPGPGFVMYAMSAQLQGLKFIGVDLTPDFELDEAAMLAAIERHQPSIVYLAYPNNPTANLWDDAVIERIVQAAPGLVVIDEAYQPFSSRSYIDRVTRHSHVLLMRTMSKFGLGRRAHRLHDGAARAGRAGRQAAPAVQRQRAELRMCAVRARPPGRVSRARPPISATSAR